MDYKLIGQLEKSAIVIDFGSSYVKAGLAGEVRHTSTNMKEEAKDGILRSAFIF